MLPKISLITLGVSDLEKARRFYQDGLGLPLHPQSVAGEVAFFDMGGTWLSLFSRAALAKDATVSEEGSGFTGFSLAHNVPTREAVGVLLAEAVAAGGRLIKPAQDAFWGGYSGYFADPDGFLWEVAWNPDAPELAASG
jgi:catechol 2,3-dioxygenase-like lactoylglutathione lyase family enzyme